MPLDTAYQFDPEEQGAPSAPMTRVTLLYANRRISCLAILDSGSAITTLTEEARKALAPMVNGRRRVGGATKAPEYYPLYLVEKLYFSNREYTNVSLVCLPSSTKVMLIGRDILNHHEILLDGPQEHMTVS